MRANPRLRQKLLHHVLYVIKGAAAGGPEQGMVPISEEFPVAIENGEGMIGYQYLHGTNADVGGFQIDGWVRAEHVQEPRSESSTPQDPGELSSAPMILVHYYLEYTWNDMIDPNPNYGTDKFKAAIGEAVSLGGAQSYRLSIRWSGEGAVGVDANGKVVDEGLGERLGITGTNLYPLREGRN